MQVETFVVVNSDHGLASYVEDELPTGWPEWLCKKVNSAHYSGIFLSVPCMQLA